MATFNTPYDPNDPRNGQPVTIMREISEGQFPHPPERMLEVRFEDGVTLTVWPEEIQE